MASAKTFEFIYFASQNKDKIDPIEQIDVVLQPNTLCILQEKCWMFLGREKTSTRIGRAFSNVRSQGRTIRREICKPDHQRKAQRNVVKWAHFNNKLWQRSRHNQSVWPASRPALYWRHSISRTFSPALTSRNELNYAHFPANFTDSRAVKRKILVLARGWYILAYFTSFHCGASKRGHYYY